MASDIMTSEVLIFALLECLNDNGISKEEIEKQTGIARSKMKTPDVLIPLSQVIKLWKLAVDVTGDQALGIHLRRRYGQ